MAILSLLLWAFAAALLLRMLLSWFPNPSGGLRQLQRVLLQVTEPVCAPLRKVLPQTGMLDLAPTIVFFVVLLIARRLA